MPSSTSSFERSVPARRWSRLVMSVAVLLAVAIGLWELAMRDRGLSTDDLGDGRAFWAVERRKLASGPADAVAIIGDSRILFDTDLGAWRRLTGFQPIQLALPGQNAQPILHDIAMDERFRGLLVIGTAELSYFAEDEGSQPVVLQYARSESPSQRVGHWLYVVLSRRLAFLDGDYTLFTLVEQRNWPDRAGVAGPYHWPWKISVSGESRQTYLWHRIPEDPYLLEHARNVWLNEFEGSPPTRDQVDRVITRTRSDIERIRGRGGEVVWVRPPSSGPLRDKEKVRFPRSEVWDRLVRETGSFGVHFEDRDAMRKLTLPDWSHLPMASTAAFTEDYVSVLMSRVEWLSSRVKPRPRDPDASPPGHGESPEPRIARTDRPID